MRLSSSGLLALLASSTLTDALPFIPDARSNRPLARRKATYSVVPVDGGSTGAAAATTVTQHASTLPPVTETELSTLFSTRVVTAYETASTVVVTITTTPSPPSSTVGPIESTPTPSCSEITTTTTTTSETIQVITGTGILTSATVESTESTTTTTRTTVNTTAAAVSMTTILPQVVTVTATPSSTAYDDGMWHTTYYYPVYETSLSSSSAYPYTSTVTSSSTASPSLGTNIGIPWNGTLALSP